MHTETSSFEKANEQFISAPFTDKTPFSRNGATSECYKVRVFGKWHFLKRPKKEFISNPIYISAFEKEFDLGVGLDHPNIVRYISKGYDADGIYILTEFVDGFTLNEFKKKNPGYFHQKSNVKKFLSQLLSTLNYLHDRQIVHSDIKPENILITGNGNNLKLIDLGLSYSDCYTEITGGTLKYGSPEQFSHPEQISFKSDMFAVGNLILYLFFGNIDLQLLNKLPQPYKKIAKECLIFDVDKRNITANSAIQLLGKTRFSSLKIITLALFAITILATLIIGESRFSGKSEKDTPQQHEDLIITPKVEETITEISVEVLTPIEEKKETEIRETGNNPNTGKLEMEISQIIRKRLLPNLPALEETYADVNADNIEVLKRLFDQWKVVCESDMNSLYKDYKNVISFEKFKLLYEKELSKINDPIEAKFKEAEM